MKQRNWVIVSSAYTYRNSKTYPVAYRFKRFAERQALHLNLSCGSPHAWRVIPIDEWLHEGERK